MKSFKHILICLLLIGATNVLAASDCKEIKTQYKNLKKSCRGLKGDAKRNCKDSIKVEYNALKRQYKSCKKKNKKSGSKYCKKLRKYKNRMTDEEMIAEVSKIIDSGKCSKEDAQKYKSAYKAGKKTSKYCRKMKKLKGKVGDQEEALLEIINSKKCSKAEYKKFKKLSKKGKKKAKYCKKLAKLQGKTTNEEEIAAIQTLLDTQECTKEAYKAWKKRIRGKKKTRKYCKKLAKLKDKFSDEESQGMIESIVSSEECSKAVYKEWKKKAKGQKKSAKTCKKMKKLLDKLINPEEKEHLQSIISSGSCSRNDYRAWKKKTKGNTAKDKWCNKIKKLRKKISTSSTEARQLDMEMMKVAEQDKVCTKNQYKAFKKRAKGFKQSKWCRKYQKILDKGKIKDDEVILEIEGHIEKGTCSKKELRNYKRIAKGKGRSKGKYCDKIAKVLKKRPDMKDKERFEELIDIKNKKQCTKADFKEAKCLVRKKVWFQVKPGKFRCVSEKKANKKIARASFKECMKAGGDRKSCRMDMKSLRATYKNEGQQKACIKYVKDFITKKNGKADDQADPVMLDKLKSMGCLSFEIQGGSDE